MTGVLSLAWKALRLSESWNFISYLYTWLMMFGDKDVKTQLLSRRFIQQFPALNLTTWVEVIQDQSVSEPHTLACSYWSSRKNSARIGIYLDFAGYRLPHYWIYLRSKSKFGSRIAGWNGKRIKKQPNTKYRRARRALSRLQAKEL